MNSGIEVFFTKVNQPWSNEQPGSSTHWVNVYSPDGVEKVGVSAPNGYASIDLPPGRYLVTGTTNGIYVNFDSNETIVNVGCGQRVCVTVIPKSLHSCIWWTRAALQLINEYPNLAPAVAKHAAGAIEMLNTVEKMIPEAHHQLPFLPKGLDALRKGLKNPKK
ncbi:MAG: hypothetical protein IT258_17600 [Saprospiraceae bacterium]|nr:hypothetical protein [Saprospiraceae bacterium]